VAVGAKHMHVDKDRASLLRGGSGGRRKLIPGLPHQAHFGSCEP
jgi:hypothetical protein